jgi:hypothetical protein
MFCMAKRLGRKENGVSDVGVSSPILFREYVGGGENGIYGWPQGTLARAGFICFSSEALSNNLPFYSLSRREYYSILFTIYIMFYKSKRFS